MSSSVLGPGRRHVARSVQSFSSSLAEKQPVPVKPAKPPSLARRLLFPQLHADTDLPPLLVSAAATDELNEELYSFIAIALRAYVHPWWTKITRYDKEFLPSITRVLTVVIRALEARVVQTDLSPLVLRDLPNILSQHYHDYRNAQLKLHTSYASGGAASLPQLFHHAQPHMAVSVDGTVDEAYVRQALDDVLKACLPVADFEADPERYIIREVLVKVVLGGVIPKLTQPWFIHQTILSLLGPDKAQDQASQLTDPSPNQPPSPPQRTFSFQALVIFFLSAIRSISGASLAVMHAYRQALGAIKKANEAGVLSNKPDDSEKTREPPRNTNTIPGSLTPLTPIPASATFSATSPPSPPPSPPSVSRSSSTISSTLSAASVSSTHTQRPAPPPADHSPQTPCNYVHPAMHLVSTLLTPPASATTPARTTPHAFIHILTLILMPFTSIISRLLPYLLYTHAFSQPALITMLQSAKGALFPGGWPAVPPPDPTPGEQVEIRNELVRRLVSLTPGPLLPVLGTNATTRSQAMDVILEPLSSAECNAHLIVFLLDLVLLALFPEMGVAVPVGGGAATEGGAEVFSDGLRTPVGSMDSVTGILTPPRPDSRPP